MSQNEPDAGPREREDKAPTKGTDAPWDRAGQMSQDPSAPDTPKPDLEKWQRTKTH